MATSAPSSTSYAMLGLLALRSWSAYELVGQSDRSLKWFFPRSDRSVYLDVKRLVALGWATGEKQRTGRRTRTVYSITDTGREALRAWLATPSLPLQVESEAALKSFYADLTTFDALRTTLEQARAEADANLDRLAAMAAVPEQMPPRMPTNTLCLRFLVEINLAAERWANWAAQAVDDLDNDDRPAVEAWTRETLAQVGELARTREVRDSF